MPQLPAAVRDAWEKRNGPAIFTTANESAMPNAIYVTCVGLYNDGTELDCPCLTIQNPSPALSNGVSPTSLPSIAVTA